MKLILYLILSIPITLAAQDELGHIRDINGDSIKISVVSKVVTNQLFNHLKEQTHIPFNYPNRGCFARAHEMSRILDELGFITAKIFIDGMLRVRTESSPNGWVEWEVHVAPIIKMKIDNKELVYVIDPSIFDEPVPLDIWSSSQIEHSRGVIDHLYITKRFIYKPSSKFENMVMYNPADIKDMENNLKKYLKQSSLSLHSKD